MFDVYVTYNDKSVDEFLGAESAVPFEWGLQIVVKTTVHVIHEYKIDNVIVEAHDSSKVKSNE